MDDFVQTGAGCDEPQMIEHDASFRRDRAEILEGLGQSQKMLPPKFFYDRAGSRLFDAICELPEYYLTRTELKIMRACVDEMANLIGAQASVIEFGSGTSLKTRLLIEALHQPSAYVPVDISKQHLRAAASSLAVEFPDLEILPVAADFTHPFQLPDPKITPLRNVVYFPGSTIGNFEPDAALEMLKVMHLEAGANGALLIGVDLVKETTILERAYNDSSGITAQFNLNILSRLNREFDADFDLGAFDHRAVYDSAFDRIEMRLISRRKQVVSVAGQSFDLADGEYIVTEHSHKYTIEGFRELAGKAGFLVQKVWTDPDQLFSVQYCTRT